MLVDRLGGVVVRGAGAEAVGESAASIAAENEQRHRRKGGRSWGETLVAGTIQGGESGGGPGEGSDRRRQRAGPMRTAL